MDPRACETKIARDKKKSKTSKWKQISNQISILYTISEEKFTRSYTPLDKLGLEHGHA